MEMTEVPLKCTVSRALGLSGAPLSDVERWVTIELRSGLRTGKKTATPGSGPPLPSQRPPKGRANRVILVPYPRRSDAPGN